MPQLTISDITPDNTSVNATTNKYTYLALGDSYTIGQSVPASENFPNQLIAILNKDSLNFEPVRIVATTGWTTDELDAGIATANNSGTLLPVYKFVSLLIGVNDQYRGRTVESYRPAFEDLLKKAIHFAGDFSSNVVVLSIPDWGVTPFAASRDKEEIAREIDAYNLVNKEIAQKYKVEYNNITEWTRQAATDLSLVAGDGLHPSGKEYKRWAERIAVYFKSNM
ncbi:MAG: SGNH/GDSL hydrolase family protein [Bacteroidia bacterium]|nr:SGNH/GDSL hydrolase family protein [Bacteroidia bacterium]